LFLYQKFHERPQLREIYGGRTDRCQVSQYVFIFVGRGNNYIVIIIVIWWVGLCVMHMHDIVKRLLYGETDQRNINCVRVLHTVDCIDTQIHRWVILANKWKCDFVDPSV